MPGKSVTARANAFGTLLSPRPSRSTWVATICAGRLPPSPGPQLAHPPHRRSRSREPKLHPPGRLGTFCEEIAPPFRPAQWRGGEGGPPGKQSRRRAARRRPLGCIPRRAPQHTRCTCAARACGGRTRRRRGSSLRTRRGSELRDSEQAGQSSIARRSYRAYLHLTPSHLTPPLSTRFVVLVCMYNVGMYTERERLG